MGDRGFIGGLFGGNWAILFFIIIILLIFADGGLCYDPK